MAKKVAKKAPVKKAAAKKKTAKKSAPVKKPAKKVAAKIVDKSPSKIVYPDVAVKIFAGDEAMTADQAKLFLGWEEEAEGRLYGDKILLIDLYGKRIRCWNNDNNRPFVRSNADGIAQEHLRKKWKLNGETGIIGKTGKTISFQHRLVGLVLAAQAWNKSPESFPLWETEPTMECVVVFGIDESDDTVNTIDTGRPRDLADVIYRSDLFADMGNTERKVVARICKYTVKSLWVRTGVNKQAFSLDVKQTHAESLDFLARHPRVLEAVKHLYEEEDGSNKKVSKYLPPTYASALLYLMGTCSSDGKAYRESDLPCESLLDTSHWDKAIEFWTLLAGSDKSMAGVRTALGKLLEDNLGTLAARTAMLIKAWDVYLHDGTITEDLIELKWNVDEDGSKTLAECPTIGGIDVGVPTNVADDEDESDGPTPEEVEAEKQKVTEEARQAKAATKKVVKKVAVKKVDETPAPTTSAKKPPAYVPKVTAADIGGVVWVIDPETPEAAWSGFLQEIFGDEGDKKGKVKVAQGFAGAGKTFDVPMSQLQSKRPE